MKTNEEIILEIIEYCDGEKNELDKYLAAIPRKFAQNIQREEVGMT